MCAENVLRLAEIDCSSPMSAKTVLNGVKRLSASTGNQQTGLRHQRQQADGLERHRLAARVRSGDDEHSGWRNENQVRADDDGIAQHRALGQFADRGNQQWMPCPAEFEAAVAGDRRRAALHTSRELGLRVQLVELGRGIERARQFLCARTERVRQRPKNPTDFRQLTFGRA